MFFSPLTYDEPLFRPPSEALSLILQVTIGCSWNQCAFCEMYTSKKFRVKNEEEILREIEASARYFPETRKVFLADGNAMVLPSRKLLKVLDKLNAEFGRLARVSAYAGSRDLENKTVEELTALRKAGLKLIYVGIETGDDELLGLINKGETAESIERNLSKARAAGIKMSVMILTGLGGKKYSHAHALRSAELVSKVQPDFLSTLVLSFPYGADHYKERFGGEFIGMGTGDLLAELHQFIGATLLDQVIFRSDHASNYLSLKGVLSKDRDRMLREIEAAMSDSGGSLLRKEWQRGL